MFDLKILDKVLSILSETKDHRIEQQDLYLLLYKDIFISSYLNDTIIEISLKRLLEDNHIEKDDKNPNVKGFNFDIKPIIYSLTSYGFTFLHRGGYYNIFMTNLSLQQQLISLQESQIKVNDSVISTNRRMYWVTFVIAFGTIVAGVYYGFEIYFFFYPNTH